MKLTVYAILNYVNNGVKYLINDAVEFLTCDHIRAKLYFAESINSNCTFKAYLCDHWGLF